MRVLVRLAHFLRHLLPPICDLCPLKLLYLIYSFIYPHGVVWGMSILSTGSDDYDDDDDLNFFWHVPTGDWPGLHQLL